MKKDEEITFILGFKMLEGGQIYEISTYCER